MRSVLRFDAHAVAAMRNFLLHPSGSQSLVSQEELDLLQLAAGFCYYRVQ